MFTFVEGEQQSYLSVRDLERIQGMTSREHPVLETLKSQQVRNKDNDCRHRRSVLADMIQKRP